MIFSSMTFLYYFLPAFLLCYYLVPKKYKKICLIIFSLIFYAYGDIKYVPLLIISACLNYFLGKKISGKKHPKLFLILGLILNFGLLFYFKYYNFFIENINNLTGTHLSFIRVAIPLGLSFYTFQNASYLIDIYTHKINDAKNLLNYMTYLLMFPHLAEGPIVRYADIEKNLDNPKQDFTSFSSGVSRFIIGLSKKVILADTLTYFSKSLASLNTPSILSYWLKAFNDTFVLYLDFSGYSDMAIGLGLMIGFKFLENFNYPLASFSITDFWRRWHISLSSWFKDYIYIPLKGSHVKPLRRAFNIFIVWLATGFWHGASWNFIFWGLYYAIILIIEKKFFQKFLDKHHLIGLIYTNVIVAIGFVIFNETDLSKAFLFIKNMFSFTSLDFVNLETLYYLKNYLLIFVLGIIASSKFIKNINEKFAENEKLANVVGYIKPIVYIILLIISTSFIIDSSSNPFLYFKF